MRLGLAAKICILAAVLVVAANGVSFLFFQDARTAVRENELAVLTDEMEDRGKALLADIDRVQTDLLQLAVAPSVRGLFAEGRDPDPKDKNAAVQLAEQLCQRRRHYRQLDFVRNDARGTVVALFAPDAAVADAASGSGRDAFVRAKDIGTSDVVFAKSTEPQRGDLFAAIRVTVPLCKSPAGASGSVEAKPVDGLVLLRLDLAKLAERLNQSARVLGFLVGEDRQYLAHPSLRVPTPIAADKANPLDERFLQTVDDASRNRGPGEPIHTGDLKLPELAYYVTTLQIAQPPTMTELRRKWEQVQQTYSDVRFSPKGANPGVLLCRGGSVDRVREAAQDLRERLGATVDYDEPFRCETFAVTMKVVRPDAGSTIASAPPWFVLGLAVATEEFEHEIQVAHRRNLWLTLAISAGAALAALGFAFYLTRPLRQMIGYADRIAAGQEPETELEVPKGHAKDELGTLARAFSSMVDQIRLRTRELRESEARIRTILNTAAEGIVTIDEQGHLESFNLAAERLFGYQAAEVRGKHFTKLLGRGAPTHLPTLFGFGSGSPTLGGGSPFASYGAESSLMSISRVNGTTREVMARRKNGSGFPAEMSVSEVILGDRLVYTAILRDVTERKQAQQASERMTVELERRVAERTAELMQANQALESARDLALEANRAKDAFLAVMSHELRTPLNAIIGYCDYWLGEADEFDTNEMRDDMRKMHVSGKHLLTLINDILDLAKIQAGKVTLDLSEFEIGGLLSELQEWVQPLVRKNSNTLTVEADANLGAMRSDRTRVRQVLLNLLSNASKFTQSGAIRLHVQRSRAAGREEIVFRVSDTGVGMKPEDVRKLFRETFFQADSSSTRKHEGTGLGLVICHKLCKLMGGDVEVQSTLGVGTTFTVRLPTVVTPALPGDRPAPTASTNETVTMQWRVATVLVIDDDVNSRKMLERILRREGYAVRTASAGAEAVKLAREIEPAAIVLDALAPNKDGWSALAALKADSRTADIPIIMATIVDDQSRGFALGGTDFITKPIDWERLGVLLRPYRSAQTSSPILVVDDDESTRSMTHRHLAAQGWHVIEASNGREALERLAGARPAVILLDLMMPEMDGFQFVERLQRDETWRTIPVVVVTAIDLTAADRQRLNGSVQQILQKGAHTPEQLLSAIRDRLNQCVVPR